MDDRAWPEPPPIKAYASEFSGAKPHRTSQFIDAGTLHNKAIPPRVSLVEGWIPGRTVTLLGGDGGAGKSLAAAQLCTCTVLARPWFGLPITPGPAVYSQPKTNSMRPTSRTSSR